MNIIKRYNKDREERAKPHIAKQDERPSSKKVPYPADAFSHRGAGLFQDEARLQSGFVSISHRRQEPDATATPQVEVPSANAQTGETSNATRVLVPNSVQERENRALEDELDQCIRALHNMTARREDAVKEHELAVTELQEVKRERDNLKKHNNAMKEAYKAKGISYDDFIELGQLRKEMPSLKAADEELKLQIAAWKEENGALRDQREQLFDQVKSMEKDMVMQRQKHEATIQKMREQTRADIAAIEQAHAAEMQSQRNEHNAAFDKQQRHYTEYIASLEHRHSGEIHVLNGHIDKLMYELNRCLKENQELKSKTQDAMEATDQVKTKMTRMATEHREALLPELTRLLESQQQAIMKSVQDRFVSLHNSFGSLELSDLDTKHDSKHDAVVEPPVEPS